MQYQALFLSPQLALSSFINPLSLKVLQNVMQIILEFSVLIFHNIPPDILKTVQLNMKTIILYTHTMSKRKFKMCYLCIELKLLSS